MSQSLERALLDKGRLAFRAKPGEVPLAIFSVLNTQGALTSAEIQKEILRLTKGVWKITLGTLHNALQNMSYERTVQESTSTAYATNKTVYTLTDAGKARARVLENKISEFWRIFRVEQPQTGTPSQVQLSIARELEAIIETIDFVSAQRPNLREKLGSQVLPQMRRVLYGLLTD